MASMFPSKPENTEKRYDGSIIPWLRMGVTHLSTNGIDSGVDSLQLTAVYSAVSKIADTVASMDVGVYRMEDGSPIKLDSHPVAQRISQSPNHIMGAYEFWQMVVSDACLFGTGNAYIDANGDLYYIPASKVTATVDELTGDRWYTYDGAPSKVPASNWIEIKAFRGLNPTFVQKQNLNTQKSIQDFGAKFFESGGMLGGLLTTKEHLSVDQMKQAASHWESEYTGSQNAHKIAILGGGFEYTPLSVPLDQLRWLEGRKYGAEEIARIFSIPPAMLGMESNTAYSNYEQQVLQFHQGCILPWVRRIEQELERKLFKTSKHQVRFNVDSLLRADLKTRSAYYHSMLSDGAFSINEVRAKEGYGPIEGGDEHHLQVNQIPLSSMKDYAASITSKRHGEDVQQLPADSQEQGESGAEAQGED